MASADLEYSVQFVLLFMFGVPQKKKHYKDLEQHDGE